MSSSSTFTLTEDETDDLLYYSRVGALSDLKELISSLQTSHSISLPSIVSTAIDPNTGNSTLHYAAANGHVEIVAYLLSFEDKSISGPSSITTSTTSPTKEPQTQTLLNHAENTPLHYASLNGHLSTVRMLVQSLPPAERADFILSKNEAGHAAAFGAENAGKEGWEDVVRYLLEHGEAKTGTGTVKETDMVFRSDDLVAGQEGHLGVGESETKNWSVEGDRYPTDRGLSEDGLRVDSTEHATKDGDIRNGDVEGLKDAETRLNEVQLNGNGEG